MTDRTIYSIGHSQHDLQSFTALLEPFQVDTLVDVRSNPFSRFAPDFGRPNLEQHLPRQGFQYVFLGHELGGRPNDPAYYDEDGHVLYYVLARNMAFLHGITLLAEKVDQHVISIMCSEGKPHDCHRHLLIEPLLVDRGIAMKHIRPGGGLFKSHELESQPTLFFDTEDTGWKSIRSVSRNEALRASSKP